MAFTASMTRVGLSLLGFAATIALLSAPNHADACGGTFCDNIPGPTVMPVDQTGENILFWIDRSGSDPHTEAHIQIQYTGDPERFAWLVPIREAPEVLVGSQALFDNLLGATQPIITLNTRFASNCGGGALASGGVGCAFGDDVAFDGFDSFDSGGETGGWGEESDGPEIIDRGFAGAFEYVILTADSVDVIVNWLDESGYQQDSDAPPILEDYLQEGFVFVAFKLRGEAGLDEIHPLALRYPGVEPCIPIRLTRIAAKENMAIRAFFLGHDRAVPQNWPHVELNLGKLDWINAANSYLANIALAIDEAGGRAFVTEYAGTDSIVSLFGIDNADWNAAAFTGVAPIDVVTILELQGLANCANDECSYAHPQVLPLLQHYLPAPLSVDEDAFYTCLECYAGLIDPVAWSAQPGFADEYEQRISGPARHAVDMLVEASYLTRMFTMISPHEMIEDPLFHESSSLGTVDNNLVATQVLPCDDAPTYIEIPGGREVVLVGNSSYPTFPDMPSAEHIERVPMVGPPQVETDNTTAIDDIIDKHNHDNLVGPSPNCSIARLRAEALLTMLVLFGIAWGCRAPRTGPKNP